MKSTPTSRNICDSGGAAACQSEISGGIRVGQVLIVNPLYPSENSAIARMKGGYVARFRTASQSRKAQTTVNSGAGDRKRIFGKLNQRSAIAWFRNGTQTLTIAMKLRT